jgi:hypothetical protein
VFGILKGRFHILKTGIRLEGPETAHEIWLTCCTLHNLLLEVDGLDERWEEGVRSDWEGELGNNDSAKIQGHAPLAIRRLQNPEGFGSRQHEKTCAAPQPFVDRPRDMLAVDDDAASKLSEGNCRRRTSRQEWWLLGDNTKDTVSTA